MRELRLYLLGPFQAMLAGQLVQGFAYDKVRALLAYLAVEHHAPHSRESLGTLLWPDADANTARTNLRKALSTLRKAICDTDASPYLIIERDTVQFNPDSNFWLDTEQITSRLDATLHHAHLQLASCESCIDDLEEAVALYRGSFLQGMLIDSLDFEEWSLIIRENLHTRILSALHELTQYYLQQGEYNLAQKHALRQVELESYREEAHRALMQSLAKSGQRSAALAQYERCRSILTSELGVEPSSETQALYQLIRSAGEAHPHNLPSQPSPLVGRQPELYEIGRLLASPDCHLLTLVGMGGMGKTSLALQAAREHLEDFLHGVFWVPLALLRHPDQVLTAMIEAMQITPGEDPETRLFDYLRGKSLLLLLDNFEHLIPSQPHGNEAALNLVNKIIQSLPNVKLLVTSRERLRLRSEWVYSLEGLPYPPDYAAESAETLPHYAAIQLFVHRAQQVMSHFPDQTGNYQQIARICKLVCGNPLGIELASGWVDQLTCQAIADSIEADLDFLVTTLRDIPDRHHSIRAVFDHSWKLLSADEQAVLRKLSVLLSPFRQAAAREISQAAPHQLTSLVNKSFLHLDIAGRYSMHLLLKQFLAQELAADPIEEQNTHRVHAAFFTRFLKEREYALTVQYQSAPLDEVGDRIADIRLAWDWAASHKDTDILSSALEGVYIYYWARNQFAEGQAALEEAVAAVKTLDATSHNQLLLARLWCRIADMIYWLGDLKAAEKLLEENITLLRSLEANEELAFALELSSRIYNWQGEYKKAKQAATAAIEYARLSGTQHILAQALNILATTICDDSGDHETAFSLYAESLALYRRLDNPYGIAKVLINQGASYYEQGDFSQAQQLYQLSLDQYRKLSYTYGIAACLNNLAMIARKLGEYERAKALIEESLALKRETGNRVAILHSLLEIGAVDNVMGNYAQAREHFCEALQMALDTQASGLIFNIVLGFAELYRQTGDLLLSADLVNWVLFQENVGQEAHSQAETLIADLESQLSVDELSKSKARVKNQNINTIKTKLLRK
jgi:DNA-binding SARP family transcriptional activator/predicted ATPase